MFKARTHAPGWAAGLYDGAAVHVYLRAGTDLAVNLATLRHEVMHAQLHAAVGCGPFWFHEGLASYFAAAPPVGELLAMLREREVYELAALRDPVLLEQAEGQAGKAYAMSLAMVLYLVDASGERAIADLVRTATSAVSRTDPLGLWSRAAPGIDERAVLEALGRRMFGLSLGSELGTALAGPVCCRGIRDVDDLRCREPDPAALEVRAAGKSQWLDGNTLCRTAW
ncbi:MAG: hypothetical protein WKG01_04615 [Kofleriaceae bacterium]